RRRAIDPIELRFAFPGIAMEAVAVVDLGKAAEIIEQRARIDAVAAHIIPQAPRDRRRERRAADEFRISKAVLDPGARGEGERVDHVEQIARVMRAQEMLEHEAVIERASALRGEIQDT